MGQHSYCTYVVGEVHVEREYFHLNLFINMYKPTITHMLKFMQRVIEEPVKTVPMSSTIVTCLIVRHFSLLDSSKQYLKNEEPQQYDCSH
jgi:hypothetical protein